MPGNLGRCWRVVRCNLSPVPVVPGVGATADHIYQVIALPHTTAAAAARLPTPGFGRATADGALATSLVAAI